MTKHTFILIASWIFLIIGIMHISRLIYGWEVYIGDFMVPMWIYWVEAFVSLYLSLLGFKLSKKEQKRN